MLPSCRVRDTVTDSIDNRSIAVLRTRLPYTDRRSLSQAWFSALHLAQIGPARGFPARRASDPSFLAPSSRSATAPNAEAAPPARASRVSGTKVDRATAREGAAAAGTRDVRSRFKDKAAFEQARSYPPFRTSLTVGVDGARIKLLVRREGSTLHVVALCAPQSAELVGRALACADTYLRRSGESVRASVRTVAQEPA